MRAVFILVFAAALVGCSGGADTVAPDAAGGADTEDVASQDWFPGADLPDEDVAWPDAADTFDAVPEIVGPQCSPGEGCFLDPCADNGDCQSGWCVEHMGEKVCTRTCAEECAQGWTCQQVTERGRDLLFLCVSSFPNLCRPCSQASDCDGAAGTEDACVDYGAEGSFCGGICGDSDDCPWGFSCQEATTVDGVQIQQCVAETGTCPCTDTSVALGLWTSCVDTNEWGSCAGKRVCTAEGLTPCDASAPAQEICNGLDEDCDGDVDEPDNVGGDYVNLCDDGNDCTTDSCEGAEGCAHESLSQGECADGDACTVGDHCEAGVCVGAAVVCDDDNPCTDDACDGLGGCDFTPNTAACDDDDPCTLGDQCQNGQCQGFPVDCECQEDTDCVALEDGDLCNGTLFCDTSKLPFLCAVLPDSPIQCDAPQGTNSICLQSVCAPTTGECALIPDHEGYPCDDGDPCTTNDHCMEGVCTPGPDLSCDDYNPCTTDSCGPDGDCVHTPQDGPCDDMNTCTTGDHCEEGDCSYTGLLDCNDDDVCTTDACDPAGGCLHTLNTAPCDDGDACTSGDHCHLGECIPTLTLTCDDLNPCTTDACQPASGCQHQPNALPCDDGNACTDGDTCVGGTCKAGAAVACDDLNPCTDDSCDPQAGCLFSHNTLPCDDGDACTPVDLCAAGACQGSGALDCDDDDPCTDDSCAPETGCLHDPNIAPCDDLDPCTVTDHCDGGVCVGGEALDCDDDDACTADSCVSGVGCTHQLTVDYQTDPANCGDCGVVCTEDQECLEGECEDLVLCPAFTGNLSIGGPAKLYGFCFYLSEPGGNCDATCAELGGDNHAVQAANSFPDNCSSAGAAGLATWFYEHGNPGNWSSGSSSTSGHGFGYGYTGGDRYGKCSSGTAPIGVYPGDANSMVNRAVVCPCFTL